MVVERADVAKHGWRPVSLKEDAVNEVRSRKNEVLLGNRGCGVIEQVVGVIAEEVLNVHAEMLSR